MSTLVLIHGFLSGRDYWHKQDVLAKHTRLFFIDLPGFGRCTNLKACTSIAEFAKSALDQINKAGIQDFDLIGHSMGGMIAQELVKLIPSRVDKLILYGTGPYGSMPKRFEPIEVSIAKLNKQNLAQDIKGTVASWFLNQQNDPNYPAALELASMVRFETYRQALLAMNAWSNEGELNLIKQETLVLWGDKDRSYSFEQQPYKLWTEIPTSHLAVIANSAHNTHLERPDIFNQTLIDFLF